MSPQEQASAWVREGKLDEACALVDQAHAGDLARVELSRVVCPALLRANRVADARRLLAAAAALKPNLPWLVDLQAQAAAAAGDGEARLVHLRRAFELAPDATEPYAALVAALKAAGRASDAEAARQEHAAHVSFAMPNLRLWEEPAVPADEDDAAHARRLYLDLLERTVSNWIYGDPQNRLGKLLPYEPAQREVGRDIPAEAHTMIGLRRLRHLRTVAEQVLREGIPGDLVECGVWRGGACILMAGVLKAWRAEGRHVVAADSFQGLPPPDPRYPKDALTTFDFHLRPELAVGAADVRANFERYGLWSDDVKLLEGYFSETLPSYPHGPIAVLRLDGDLYSSTMDSLVNLYDRVSRGGYVISDDYGMVIDARRAVLDFRSRYKVTEELKRVDGDAICWRKLA